MTTLAASSAHVSAHSALTPSRKTLWTGRILSGLAVAFLTMDTVMKVLHVASVDDTTKQLGYPPGSMFGIGLIELVCLVVYCVPQTAVLGAVLWTGYLGGAIATHVRVENPLFSHVLFPTYVAALGRPLAARRPPTHPAPLPPLTP